MLFVFNLLLCLGQLNVSLIIMFHSPNTSGVLIKCLISESQGYKATSMLKQSRQRSTQIPQRGFISTNPQAHLDDPTCVRRFCAAGLLVTLR